MIFTLNFDFITIEVWLSRLKIRKNIIKLEEEIVNITEVYKQLIFNF